MNASTNMMNIDVDNDENLNESKSNLNDVSMLIDFAIFKKLVIFSFFTSMTTSFNFISTHTFVRVVNFKFRLTQSKSFANFKNVKTFKSIKIVVNNDDDLNQNKNIATNTTTNVNNANFENSKKNENENSRKKKWKFEKKRKWKFEKKMKNTWEK